MTMRRPPRGKFALEGDKKEGERVGGREGGREGKSRGRYRERGTGVMDAGAKTDVDVWRSRKTKNRTGTV